MLEFQLNDYIKTKVMLTGCCLFSHVFPIVGETSTCLKKYAYNTNKITAQTSQTYSVKAPKGRMYTYNVVPPR